jgi:hypothetical protein
VPTTRLTGEWREFAVPTTRVTFAAFAKVWNATGKATVTARLPKPRCARHLNERAGLSVSDDKWDVQPRRPALRDIHAANLATGNATGSTSGIRGAHRAPAKL